MWAPCYCSVRGLAKSLVSIQVMGLGTGARESGKDFCHWKMMLEMMAMVMQVMMIRGLFVPGEAGGPPAIPSAPLAQLLTHSLGRGSCLAQPMSPLLQYKQPPGSAFSVAWPYTHTHTHTHTRWSQMTLLLLGTPSTPSDVSGGQWCRDAGGQGQEATWLQA